MTFEIVLMLTLIAVTLTVFILEVLPIEVTALGLLGTLLVLRFVDFNQAVLGLSNKAVVTVGCMLVMSHALVKTGVLEVLADHMSRWAKDRKWLGISIFLLSAGILSGFLNNTAVVAIFIPLAMSLCHRFHLSPSKVLIPLSYTSILGGTLTLIGTSTNLLVSSMAEEAGLAPIGMFEFTKLGIIFLAIGIAYISLTARRLLPARSVISSLTRKYHLSTYLSEMQVPPTSPLIGRSCRDVGLNANYDILALAIIRRGERFTENIRSTALESGDILIVQGTFENMLRFRKDHGVALLHDLKLSDKELEVGGQMIVEGLITQTSSLIGSTLKETDFRRHFGAFVLAVRRHGSTLRSKIAHVRLEFGDTLLIMAPRKSVEDLRRTEDLIIVSEMEFSPTRGRFWWLVIVLLPLIVILAAIGLLDIAKGAILATTLLLLTGVLTPQEAYRAVDWSVLFLIAAFVPVGQAMVQTGTASFLASGILAVGNLFPVELRPQVSISLLYLLTSLITQMISNNASAIMLVPVCLSMASSMSVDARPFLVAVCFAASAEFMTPTGYQTNTMVYGPGSYRFFDYTRFGAPLNLVFWLWATALIPYFWPF